MSPKTMNPKSTKDVAQDELSAADVAEGTPLDVKTGQPARQPKPVDSMSDQEVLQRTGNGRFGPALLASTGQEDHGIALHKRAQSIMRSTAGGALGPALTDPDYHKKRTNAILNTRDARIEKERRLALLDEVGEQSQTGLDTVEHGLPPSTDPDLNDFNPDDIDHPDNPWSRVTLSGAKILARENAVSYPPRIKRVELIEHLRRNGVTPPSIDDDDLPEEINEEKE